MTLELTTTTVLIGVGSLILLLVVIVWGINYYYQNVAPKVATQHHKGDDAKNLTLVKYPEVDTFKLIPSIGMISLVVSLLLMIFAFSWTKYEEKSDFTGYLTEMPADIEMATPRTAEPPPPPPPPPSNPQTFVAVAVDMPDLKTVIFEDQSITEESYVEAAPAPPKKIEAAAPAPPPPPPPPTEGEIFKVVEENPTFPGCEDVADKEMRKQCAENKLMEFIYANIQYPPVARENGIEGMVVLQFVVEPDGSISNIKIVRDIGAGCGEEAARVISMMPAWNPGKQRGRPVRVMFTLPVRFILE